LWVVGEATNDPQPAFDKFKGDSTMRSFAGRDILSLKDFERQEFFRVFEIAARLEPIARERQMSDLLKARSWSPPSTSPPPAPAWPTKRPCCAWAAR
jgi:hypothetical protein